MTGQEGGVQVPGLSQHPLGVYQNACPEMSFLCVKFNY